jgi:peptidyl-dipeptidase Dcp
MRNLISNLFLSALLPVMVCAQGTTDPMKASAENPLLRPWSGPYGGCPPFASVKVSDFRPALLAAMEMKRAEIDRIARNPEPATFENTFVALESAGQTYQQVRAVYDVWSANLNSDEFGKTEAEMEPLKAAFEDEISQNEALFRRIKTVYESPDFQKRSEEDRRLGWRRYFNFVLAGALLDSQAKAKVTAINQKLAGLYTRFSQNLLADERDLFLEITSSADLGGLSPSQTDAARSLAAAKGKPGSWIIANTRSSVDPFLTYSDRRDLREKVWRMFINRGDNGGPSDNNAIITEILLLRARRALLLGYETHAHWRLANMMAQKPEKAMALMESVWGPAVALVKKEVAEMQAIADREGAGIRIEPWDYRYYAEKVRKDRYDLDQNEVKKYLQLEKLKEGMFWVAGELFGLRFTPVRDVPVFHPDVQVYKVTDGKTGRLSGLWYFDPYARPGKRSGAWMTAYRDQHRVGGKEVITLVSNNSNFLKGKPGEPVLISWDDAETLFHEFGHALHGLCSNVTYPTLSGTSVPQDYVEFPSQILERWLSTGPVLQKYALHYRTGKPMPEDLAARINRASAFNQGFQTVEATASALVDMQMHLAGEKMIDPDAFERETLQKLGMPSEIVMRHRTPQFSHIFSSDEYSAGYYSYLWSDVISADAFEAFAEAPGGAYDKEVARRLFENVFSAGNKTDPALAYPKFRGKEPSPAALMKNRGLK